MADQSRPSSAPPVSVRTLSPNQGANKSGTHSQGPQVRQSFSKKPANYSSVPFWTGLALSVLWVGIVLMALMKSGGSYTFAGLPLVNWAIGICAISSPVGLIWMITAYLQRAADVQSAAEPLRRHLMMITGESGAAEVRIRRFNQAIREQLELLRSTQSLNQNDIMALMDRVRQHKNDLEQFEQQSIYQVKEIQEVIRRSMQHIEQLFEDKFTMLRILDNKLVQSGDEVSRQTESVRDQMASLLQEIEANAHLISLSLERAARDSKKLSDTARAQESSLITATETAAGSLQELSGKIDHTIARFLERVGAARKETEQLGSAIESQTRMLDHISVSLPARVSEIEAALNSVTDRLHASEQMAREQAVQLSDRLENLVEGLENILDKFSSRLGDVDSNLRQRHMDFDGLVVRISGATDDLAQKLEGSITGLGERAQNTLRQFAIVNEEARKGANEIAEHMAETSARYEAAIRQLSGLTEGNNSQLQALSSEIQAQLSQFDTYQNTLRQTSDELQSRSSAALQNLQHVLERLLATRDAAQSVGDTLTGKLLASVDQNNHIIARINEAAQMTMHALATATESLVRKEGDIATQGHMAEAALRSVIAQMQEQARAAENSLREQNMALTSLMREAQERLESVDSRLKDFAIHATLPVRQAVQQLEQSAEQGSAALDTYGNKVLEQINRLQTLNARVSEAGEEATRATDGTLSALEQFNNRFLTIRSAQEEIARSTLEQFSAMAVRLQDEVGSLGDHTTKAVTMLQQAAADVSRQSQDLLREAQDSGSKIQLVTSALQNEAMQIRAMLQKQADDLNADLARAEHQFIAAGDSLKQRTDSAYALLDRMAAHYTETTRAVAEEFESRASKLGLAATEAYEKVSALNSAITQQSNQISNSVSQMEAQAMQLSSAGSKTLQQLSALNEKFAVTQEATVTGAQSVINRLEEVNSSFQRQNNSLGEAAQNAANLVQKAGAAFGEQASKMVDITNQIENSLRGLNAATMAFSDQSAQIRSAMEQHNQRLISSLNDSVSQLDAASLKMQQATSHASQGVDQAAAKFNEVTQTASERINNSSQELLTIAGKAESTLEVLSAGITRQVASLNLVSEQLSEQHRMLTAANENHRNQLIDLFDKLSAAHSQASEVAERTIARLADSIQQLHRQCGALSDQSQMALANIRDAGTGFADQAMTLLQNAQQAEQQARTVLSVTSALQDQARQLREALHTEGERTGEMLGILIGKLSAGTAEMRDLSSTAEITLTSMQHGLSNQSNALNSIMQQITDRQRSLTTALDAQRDVLNGLLGRLTLAQDETITANERCIARLTESSNIIAQQLENIEKQSQSTLLSLHNASTDFANEASALGRHAEQAEQLTKLLGTSASTLHEQTKGMREAMQEETGRLGNVLGEAMEKLISSSSTLQNISASTGSSLADLQAVIDHKVSSLSSLMQQITDRQRDLTSAMEAQRETLTSLVNRLALAQDETAASTERTIARIVDSSQQISRQMEAIDAQAQSTLANIRAVSSVFADEAGALSMNAQQTEQQARGLLSVTAGMQDQARQLREAMQGESARVLEQLNNVVAQLDVTNQQLRQQSSSMVGTMDQSVLQITTLAKATDEALQKHAAHLVQVAEQAEGRVIEAGEKIRSHVKVVSEAGEQVEQQARKLADTAEHATSRLAALRSSMAESDKEGRDILARAAERIEELRNSLQRELQQVAEISQLAVQQVAAAGQALMTQSDSLRANLAASESALTEAASLMREESSQLPSVLDRGVEYISAARKAFASEAEGVNQTLVKTADRFISVTGATRETMIEEMRNIGTVAEAAGETLNQLNQALAKQIEAIKQGASTISSEQAELVEKSDQSIARLVEASERLEKVRTNALQTAEKLAREFGSIETMAASTTQRLAAAGENLGKQISQLSQTAERTEGQINNSTQSFREQMERIRSGVQMQIDDINRGLMQITAQLERTGNSLRSATAGSTADIEKITIKLDQITKDTSHQLTDRTARMRVATEEVAKLLSGFGDQMDVLLSRLSMAGDGIKRHEGELISRLQTALTHVSSITERLEANRLLTADVADETVSRLSEVAAAVEAQLKDLKHGSDTVAGVVKNIGRLYNEQTGEMNRSLSGAQEQITAMIKSIEEMQQRADRMRVALKLQTDDLMNTIGGIMHQLDTTGDALSGAVSDALKQKAVRDGKNSV